MLLRPFSSRVIPNHSCMDPEPLAVSRPSSQVDESLRSFDQGDIQGMDEEDPFSLNEPSIAFLGLAIAIATIVIPLVAVLIDRPLGRENIVPTALERDGSKSSPPISLTRPSESRS